ncbi:MAG: immunoglobulin-like domain-containing protein [Candidatus Paceibacterota bacterium]|jgi:hypothetical protein
MIKYVSSLVFATLFLFAGTAQAATLYTQGQGGGSTVPSNSAIGGSDSDVNTYASFTPTQSGTVDNVSWQGTSNILYPGYADGFTVEVISNQPQNPDGILSNTELTKVVATGTLGAANATLVANGRYDYNLDVTPFAIQAGVKYYISISSNGIAPWGWTSATGSGALSYYRGLHMWLRANGIPSFSLNNVHNSFVDPTPVALPPTTIVPVPAPVATTVAGRYGEFQGMITSTGKDYVTINNFIVTYDGDTVMTFNGGLNALAVGEIVNYAFIVDGDGVYIAQTMDIYPTEATSGTARVSGLGVDNATGGVALALYGGGTVEYFQPYTYITGLGTNTSSGNQLVTYVGFINPTNGHILATSGYTTAVPVLFKPILPTATVGHAYSTYAIDYGVFGGANPYAVAAVGLPAGMTNTMGTISGVPTTAGTYEIAMTAMGSYTVGYQQIGKATTTLVVLPAPEAPAAPITFVTSVPNGQVNTSYPIINLLTSGIAPIAVSATGVPTGMTVSTSGYLSGVPYAAGTYTITLSATDSVGATGTTSVTVTVNAAPLPPSAGTTIANGTVGVLYTPTSIVSPSVSLFALTGITGIPSGMAVSYLGILSGTPTTAGTYPIAFTAVNNSFVALKATTTLVVDPVAVVVVPPADTVAPIITMNGTNATLVAGTSYVDAGATCADNVDASCAVVTTSTVNTALAGSYTVTYGATDVAGNVATSVVRTVVVTPAPVAVSFVTSLANAQATVAYAGASVIATGVAPFTVTASGVPAGMTISANGDLSGTPTVYGTFAIVLSATDSVGTIGSGSVTLVIDAAPTIITSGAGTISSVGRDFIVIGEGLNAADHVFYTPTPAGTTFIGGTTTFTNGEYVIFTGTVDVLGSVQATSMSVYPVVAFMTTLPNGQEGSAYTALNMMTSGTAPFSVVALNVPAGMNVSSTGIISGTPTVAGIYTITLQVTDGIGNIGRGTTVLTVDAAPVVVLPPADTVAPIITMNGTNATLALGTSYVDAGATCADNVDASCAVVTTSTVNTAVAGSYAVTYGATDVAGNIATSVVRTVTVNPAPVVIVPPTTTYTSTGKKAEGSGTIASYNAATSVMTLTNSVVLRFTPTTTVKLNGSTLSTIGKKVQYKGIKNTDASVTLTSIEVN